MADLESTPKANSLHKSPLFSDATASQEPGYDGASPEGLSNSYIDEDGQPMRTGTVWTASAHIITAVIGSGVLSLAWSMAQLGWIAGPVVLLSFAVVTYFTSLLLADCYRSPDPVTGNRNYTYMDAIRANLGAASPISFPEMSILQGKSTVLFFQMLGFGSQFVAKQLGYHWW